MKNDEFEYGTEILIYHHRPMKKPRSIDLVGLLTKYSLKNMNFCDIQTSFIVSESKGLWLIYVVTTFLGDEL